MKYQIAWRSKGTTLLHFSPKLLDDRREAEYIAEGLSLEHVKYDHGVQECDDDGHRIGNVTFAGEVTELIQKMAPKEQNDACHELIDTKPSSPSYDPSQL